MKARVIPDTWPSETHPTIAFMREIADGVDPFETSLFERIALGEAISRHIGTSGERAKVRIRSRDQFLQYAGRVSSLLELVANKGIQPILGRANADPNIARRKEGDIGVAMLDNEVFFYRKGHHRLGAAMALGVEHVPCQCYFFSNADESISDLRELKNRTISAFRDMT